MNSSRIINECCETDGCTGKRSMNTTLCNSCLTRYHEKRRAALNEAIALRKFVGEATAETVAKTPPSEEKVPMSVKYPKYYKAIPEGWTEIDVYGVCKLFPVDDDSGCIHHAVKKLLVPGTRTGGKSFHDDIREARDTLTRWLELYGE